MYSVWRPIHHPVEDMPLAVCDGSTVQPDDLMETDHVRTYYAGSTMYVLDRPEHRWHYLSRQAPDEVLMFKNFDSSTDVAASCTLGKICALGKKELASNRGLVC